MSWKFFFKYSTVGQDGNQNIVIFYINFKNANLPHWQKASQKAQKRHFLLVYFH
jgi:hypothetical protein